MRKWRVGTLSMGILLVALGAGLIVAMVNKIVVVDLFSKWWPLLFVLLGIEILGQLYLNKGEEIKVKYDIFSIFIVFIIVISGLGVQCLNEFGITRHVNVMLDSQNYLLETQPIEFAIDQDIKKMVIEAPPAPLQIHTSNADAVISRASVSVTADSKEKAMQIVETSGKCNNYIAGDTCYISFDMALYGSDFGYDNRLTGYTLIIPDKYDVVIKGSDHCVEIDTGQIKNNWQIYDMDTTTLNISDSNDFLVNTQVHYIDDLRGNVDWNITENHAQESSDSHYVRGQYKIGEGKHKIDILDGDRVVLNYMN